MGKLQRKFNTNTTKNQSDCFPHTLSSTTQSRKISGTNSSPTAKSRKENSETNILGNGSPPLIFHSSIRSILDDPFFRNYISPQTLSVARELDSAISAGFLENERFIAEFSQTSPMSTTLEKSSNLLDQTGQSTTRNNSINLAIIGAPGVGKSTLIQRALGLSSPQNCHASVIKISRGNNIVMAHLLEMDIDSLDINSSREINWSTNIGGHSISRIDGALLLHNVTDKKSLAKFPAILDRLANAIIPTVLVSCKCDLPNDTWEVNTDLVENLCFPHHEAVKITTNVTETVRFCLTEILKSVVKNTNVRENGLETNTPYLFREVPFLESKLRCQYSKPRLSGSKNLMSRNLAAIDCNEATPLLAAKGKTHFREPRVNLRSRSYGMFLDVDPSSEADLFVEHPENSPITLDSDDECLPILNFKDDNIIMHDSEDFSPDKSSITVGSTLDELVDRLTGQTISRANKNFIDIFLCLYRQFAAPSELLLKILARLDLVSKDRNLNYLIRADNQFRILNILSKWISTYPGDFASPTTSKMLEMYINSIIDEPELSTAAYEIRLQLLTRVAVDDDTAWAKSDADVELNSRTSIEPLSSSLYGPKNNSKGDTRYSAHSSFEEYGNEETCEKTCQGDSRIRPASSTISLSSVEDFDKEAATLVSRNMLPLSKFRFYFFMQTSVDEISDEMTRIDWIMFSTIRLRDLVRHVTLTSELKGRWKGLTNVSRMISHFNHIARWVANMILMRDKAKYRALMLEKFMDIAFKLRQLNNYNGLAAVLADVQGRFSHLMMLMGTQKSHFAYRLAWKSSSSFRIPFLPLHRRDLVAAEEGSRTFVGTKGECINQKKFDVLSEIILPIMKSQWVPYPNLIKSKSIRELILDCKILDDEELYQRSLAVEGNASSASEFGKRKFSWFQKQT